MDGFLFTFALRVPIYSACLRVAMKCFQSTVCGTLINSEFGSMSIMHVFCNWFPYWGPFFLWPPPLRPILSTDICPSVSWIETPEKKRKDPATLPGSPLRLAAVRRPFVHWGNKWITQSHLRTSWPGTPCWNCSRVNKCNNVNRFDRFHYLSSWNNTYQLPHSNTPPKGGGGGLSGLY